MQADKYGPYDGDEWTSKPAWRSQSISPPLRTVGGLRDALMLGFESCTPLAKTDEQYAYRVADMKQDETGKRCVWVYITDQKYDTDKS